MSEPFIGEIRMAGFNFAPRNWAFCNGQLLSINQNTALFSLLGTTYGGDGQTTFALPNLQGRVPMHQGQGSGLTPRTMGELAGQEAVTLISTQMPAHNHLVNVFNDDGTAKTPVNSFPAAATAPIYSATAGGGTMNPQALSVAGGSQPHNNIQPYLVVNFIIALNGIFPSRN